jgi:hypothetical protein
VWGRVNSAGDGGVAAEGASGERDRRVEEAGESEGGGGGLAWRGAAARRWAAVAWRWAAAAWPPRVRVARSRATVEGGRVGVTRDSAVDRWTGTRRGPDVSGWVRGEAARRGGSARC